MFDEFDTAGRLTHSAFAQSSANSSYPFYADLANPTAAKATRRAHVVYDYLPSGQLDEVRYAWQDLSGSTYTDTYLFMPQSPPGIEATLPARPPMGS